MAKFITSVQRTSHGSIEALSGQDPSGAWILSRAEIVAAIHSGEEFIVEHPVGHYADTRVIVESGHEYVATVSDGTKTDNIGSLPRTE